MVMIDGEKVHAAETTLGPGNRVVGQEWSRSPVYARNGIAATAQPLASQIAVDVLKQGGSAVDAAIAANAALGLMEPTGNGMGGDLFAIVWDPETEKLYGLNASGRSAEGWSYEDMKGVATEEGGIPFMGVHSVSVPGAVDGWFELHDKFGRLSMSEVLAPAIDYAENGFPVSPVIASYWKMNLKRFGDFQDEIEEFDNATATYFADGPVQEGGMFRNPDLAATFGKIAEGGRDAFYKGEIAQTIDAYMQRIGGHLRLADFEAHESEWVEPGTVSYKGYDVYELPPNGQGFAALQMINILKNVDLSQWDRGAPEPFHYMTEAKRLAFEDVAKYYADYRGENPAVQEGLLEGLLSESYGQERFALIDPKRALKSIEPGMPWQESDGDTTYLTVADKDGMMVSLIQSNYAGMGSGLVPDGLGFMLQNRGALFTLEEGHANQYAPGKRPFHTIIPAFVTKDGEPVMSFGLMGGAMQPQGHVQVLANIIDYGMNIQEAGDAARFNHSGGRQPTGVHEDPVGTLSVEEGVADATVKKLRRMGHNVEVLDNGAAFGGYQAIWRDPETGVYHGATEMRKDGTVAGY